MVRLHGQRPAGTLLFRQCVSGSSRYFSHSRGRIYIYSMYIVGFSRLLVFLDLSLSCLYCTITFFLTTSTNMIRKEVLLNMHAPSESSSCKSSRDSCHSIHGALLSSRYGSVRIPLYSSLLDGTTNFKIHTDIVLCLSTSM